MIYDNAVAIAERALNLDLAQKLEGGYTPSAAEVQAVVVQARLKNGATLGSIFGQQHGCYPHSSCAGRHERA